MNNKEEHDLQVHCVKLLRAYGRIDIAWWAVPNGGLRGWKTGIELKEEGVKKGVHDLHFVIDGDFITVELKAEGGRLSEEQDEFWQDVERAGGFCFVAFGLNEALGVLHGINAFRPGITFTTPLDGRGVRESEPAAKAAGRQRSLSPVKRLASRRRASPKPTAAQRS
jgi:VRR-NUC domain